MVNLVSKQGAKGKNISILYVSSNHLVDEIDTGDNLANRSSVLEANASALKARMESIKSQSLERRQHLNSMSTSHIINVDDDESNAVESKLAATSNLEKLHAELQALRDRERSYVEHIAQIEEENEKFQLIAVEFEQIFHQLVKDKEASEAKYRQEILELTKERDHLQEDVVGIERSFDDLHRRFDNLKTKVVEFRKVRISFFLIQTINT